LRKLGHLPTHCRLWHLQVPIFELPPRRKVVWVWICVSWTKTRRRLSVVYRYKLTICQCYCGHGGMKVSVDPCPRCGVQRCPNCETQRFNTRSHEYTTRFGVEEEREVGRRNHEQRGNQWGLTALPNNSASDDTWVGGLRCPTIPNIKSLIQFATVYIS
jgi:hypothetical protein